MSKDELNLHLYELKVMQLKIDSLIMKVPTGAIREKLTDINIALYHVIDIFELLSKNEK